MQATKLYMIPKTTLFNKIHRCSDQVLFDITKQKLTPEEKESIKGWILDIESWYFPLRVFQLWKIAEKLLQARGDYKILRVN